MSIRNPIYQEEFIRELCRFPEVIKVMKDNPHYFCSTSDGPYLGLRRDNHKELKEYFKFCFSEHIRPLNLLSRSQLVNEKLLL